MRRLIIIIKGNFVLILDFSISGDDDDSSMNHNDNHNATALNFMTNTKNIF